MDLYSDDAQSGPAEHVDDRSRFARSIFPVVGFDDDQRTLDFHRIGIHCVLNDVLLIGKPIGEQLHVDIRRLLKSWSEYRRLEIGDSVGIFGIGDEVGICVADILTGEAVDGSSFRIHRPADLAELPARILTSEDQQQGTVASSLRRGHIVLDIIGQQFTGLLHIPIIMFSDQLGVFGDEMLIGCEHLGTDELDVQT